MNSELTEGFYSENLSYIGGINDNDNVEFGRNTIDMIQHIENINNFIIRTLIYTLNV